MQRRKPFFLAASVCLLIGGAPEFTAAQTTPPASVPAAPAAPAAVPAAPADPRVPTKAAPATAAPVATPPVAVATRNPETIKVLVDNAVEAATKDWSQVYLLGSWGTLPDKRVSVDRKNAKIKDVLKDALDQSKLDYVFNFDADVPDDAHVSVKLDNVKIGTAMDAITESAGLAWQALASPSDKGGVVIRVGQKLPNAAGSVPVLSEIPHIHDLFTTKNGTPDIYTYRQTPGSKALRTPYTQATPAPLQDTPQYILPSTSNNSALSAYTTIARSNETRSTFTCPNCHNQVTIIRKNVAVDCPTCHRAFEAGWKVCPFDGTKRPVAKDDWRFCPICGKAIPDGVASLFTVPSPETETPNWSRFQPGLTTPNYYAYQPYLDLKPFVAPSLALPDATLPVIHPPAGDYR